ncbi:hypothetical protein HD806DRAFT_293344 [Xylariaceae sp. AK1471]|nr:hypothetical protein HD806DRAFT_293344 [Xylariaceae sp. AK1471]
MVSRTTYYHEFVKWMTRHREYLAGCSSRELAQPSLRASTSREHCEIRSGEFTAFSDCFDLCHAYIVSCPPTVMTIDRCIH